MMLNEFEVRSYGGQELAVFYGLDLMPASAGKRLSKWVGETRSERQSYRVTVGGKERRC